MVPLIHDALYGGKHIGLVISPLKSLMIDQCQQNFKMLNETFLYIKR